MSPTKLIIKFINTDLIIFPVFKFIIIDKFKFIFNLSSAINFVFKIFRAPLGF